MAVGDVVNGIFTTTGTDHSFQPAAGVEIAITSILGANAQYLETSLTDGVTLCRSYLIDGGNWSGANANIKIMINNTNYLSINASAGAPPGYTGIQIK